MPSQTTFIMTRKKETKGTVVFENGDAPISSVYIRKGNPFAMAPQVRVTLETLNEDAPGKDKG